MGRCLGRTYIYWGPSTVPTESSRARSLCEIEHHAIAALVLVAQVAPSMIKRPAIATPLAEEVTGSRLSFLICAGVSPHLDRRVRPER